MKVIGITGGIGSGKSVACSIFQILGVPVYNADDEAKKLYEKYPELTAKVQTEISASVIDKNGKIDKKKLAEIIFADDEKLKLLNSFVHPLVRKDFLAWCELHKDEVYVIKEAAILFESGANKDCNYIISISSPLELRIQRVRERDRKSRVEIDRILSSQWSDEERSAKSDFIIYNDEKDMLIPQVLQVHDQLMKEDKKLNEEKNKS